VRLANGTLDTRMLLLCGGWGGVSTPPHPPPFYALATPCHFNHWTYGRGTTWFILWMLWRWDVLVSLCCIYCGYRWYRRSNARSNDQRSRDAERHIL